MDVASPQTLRLGPIVPDGHTHQQTEVGMAMRLPPGAEFLRADWTIAGLDAACSPCRAPQAATLVGLDTNQVYTMGCSSW
jgi:hypothetical protein